MWTRPKPLFCPKVSLAESPADKRLISASRFNLSPGRYPVQRPTGSLQIQHHSGVELCILCVIIHDALSKGRDVSSLCEIINLALIVTPSLHTLLSIKALKLVTGGDCALTDLK